MRMIGVVPFKNIRSCDRHIIYFNSFILYFITMEFNEYICYDGLKNKIKNGGALDKKLRKSSTSRREKQQRWKVETRDIKDHPRESRVRVTGVPKSPGRASGGEEMIGKGHSFTQQMVWWWALAVWQALCQGAGIRWAGSVSAGGGKLTQHSTPGSLEGRGWPDWTTEQAMWHRGAEA